MKAYKTPHTVTIADHLSNFMSKDETPNVITAEAQRKKAIPPPNKYIEPYNWKEMNKMDKF